MIYTTIERTSELRFARENNNPFVAWDNLARNATISGTTPLSGGDGFNAVNGTTADYWLPDVTGETATLIIDLPSLSEISCVAIAAHNLHEFGGSVSAEMATLAPGAGYVSCGEVVTPDDGGVIMWRFKETTQGRVSLTFSGLTAGDALAVGVVFVGNDVVIPSRIYQGFAPVITPNLVTLTSKVSEGGNLMGSSFVSAGSTAEMSLTYIRPSFIRGTFKPFMKHYNEGGGFFWAWRPEKYPEDVHYGWRSGAVLNPTNSGPKDYMDISLSMRVHNGG